MMEVQHVNIKIYLSTPKVVDLNQAIPVFHRWIQNNVLDELWIDVANYIHVPAGPGVLLIGYDAFYSLEFGAEERLGLMYNRRTPMEGSNKDRILGAIRAVLQARALLEAEQQWQTKLCFSTDELKLSINDRYFVPNEQASFDALKADIQTAITEDLGANFNLYYKQNDPRRRFEVTAKQQKKACPDNDKQANLAT